MYLTEDKIKNHANYDAIIEDVFNGNIDKPIMDEALKRANGNQSRAEALYVIYMLKNRWPANAETKLMSKR